MHPDGADQTPPEGITDPNIHARYGGIYLKKRLAGVIRLKQSHPGKPFAELSDMDALIIAHNAGEGNLQRYPDIPETTKKYLANIHRMAGTSMDACVVSDGTTTGSITPSLVMDSDGYHVDLAATGTDQASTYQRFQCTWWADIRRRQIGKPFAPHMGNGGQWGDTARQRGIPVDMSPRPGDAISFQPGVHGSSPIYGHVAIVETVNADGSILISQSGTGWMAVVVETISGPQLRAMGSGITFIH